LEGRKKRLRMKLEKGNKRRFVKREGVRQEEEME
jgi:hypothetical protein